jgi:hypothetical protein
VSGPLTRLDGLDRADLAGGSRSPPTTCPLCGGPAFGWITLPDPGTRPTVGMPASVGRVIDRCQDCGAGIARADAPPDLETELARVSERRADGSLVVRAPNRGSIQASIGGDGWAPLADWDGRLLLTPEALGRLAERTGRRVRSTGFETFGRNQRWSWQTLLNGLTLHPNFAHEVRAGRLRPQGGRGPMAFAIDCVVTVLAAPLVAVVSVPLELAAVALGRGGELAAELEGRIG